METYMKIVQEVPKNVPKNAWVALDTEFFGMEKRKMHRPTTGTFACLSVCYDPEIVYVITEEKDIPIVLENVKDCVWIFHNAGFDLVQMRRWSDIPRRKKIWDVMIIERIMCGGLYDSYSLEDVVRRRLDLRMHKEVRDTFEKSDTLTPQQLEYAANDAYVTLLACEAQKKEITSKDFKIWTDVDRKALWAIMDFKGFRLDVEAWKNLAIANENTAKTIKESLDFNPASPAQVKALLIKKGFKGLKDTQEKTLENAINKYPEKEAVGIAKKVLEYRMYAKRASTYGINFIDNYVEKEDDVEVIHAGYWVVGTETGRTASSSPNMQNIIARETNEFRKCFIARPNHKLVIADMGQQELRDVAFLSQDKKLINLLQDKTQDVFVGMAKMMYKRNILENDPFRKQVKNTVYGVNYGMSADGFAERYDLTIEEAQSAIDLYFATFPELYSWVTMQKKQKHFVETIAGRRIWLNPYSDQCERNAVNAPVQGSAADQMKIALGNIHEKWNFPFPFCCVGYIHDELIFDVPEEYANGVGEFISKEMVDAAEAQCFGVPFIADFKVCGSWAEKEQ